MQNLQAEYVDYNSLKFPTTVYKYREANNPYHKTVLTEQILFLSPPDIFEDKMDCHLQVRYDLMSDDETVDYFYEILKYNLPNADDLFLRQSAIRKFNSGMFKDVSYLKQAEDDFWKNFNNRYGVLSVTAISNNIKMWKAYSANFKGYCVGFNSKLIFPYFGGGGKVNYPRTLPIIKPNDSYIYKMATIPFNKLGKYRFEKEYRLVKMWPETVDNTDRQIKIPKEAFTELIIGYNLDKHTQKLLYNQIKAINVNAKVKIASMLKNKVVFQPYK